MKRLPFFRSVTRAAAITGALVLSPLAVLPAFADEEEYAIENQEDAGWFDRAAETAGPASGEADEFESDETYFLNNEEDASWLDRTASAAEADQTDADEFD